MTAWPGPGETTTTHGALKESQCIHDHHHHHQQHFFFFCSLCFYSRCGHFFRFVVHCYLAKLLYLPAVPIYNIHIENSGTLNMFYMDSSNPTDRSVQIVVLMPARVKHLLSDNAHYTQRTHSERAKNAYNHSHVKNQMRRGLGSCLSSSLSHTHSLTQASLFHYYRFWLVLALVSY